MNYDEIKEQWNLRSDDFNSWDELSLEKQVEFAYSLGSGQELEVNMLEDSNFEIIPIEKAKIGEYYWAKFGDVGWEVENRLVRIDKHDKYPFVVEYLYDGRLETNSVNLIGIKL